VLQDNYALNLVGNSPMTLHIFLTDSSVNVSQKCQKSTNKNGETDVTR